jgi:hypothetical protein
VRNYFFRIFFLIITKSELFLLEFKIEKHFQLLNGETLWNSYVFLHQKSGLSCVFRYIFENRAVTCLSMWKVLQRENNVSCAVVR